MTKAQAAAGHDDEGPSEEEWPLWKLFLIALPQLGVSVLWTFVGANSAPYMRHLGMNDSLATLNNMAGPITGFFTGPIVGAWSDTLTSRFGRRRPVIAAGLLSTWVAGMVFTSAEHVLPKGVALCVAAPMFWVMDVTINMLQTPYRALVSDLASKEQQLPMQVIFVVIMATGNFVGYTVMAIYKIPTEHMAELMFGVVLLNTVLVGIQFAVSKEKPFKPKGGTAATSACAPVLHVVEAVRGSPGLLYHLAAVQCLVWIGITAWNGYAGQWFGNSVYQGDELAPKGSPKYDAFEEGIAQFKLGGQLKSVVQLVASLVIIAVLLNTRVRPRYVYAPTIFIGAVASVLSGYAVGHNGTFALYVMMASVLPETGSFAIPFGLVAILNRRAAEEGKPVSTAVQMALLNCCVTVGQQICTTTLAAIEGRMSLEAALPLIFMISAACQAVSGTAALFLDDRPGDDDDEDSGDGESSEESDSEGS